MVPRMRFRTLLAFASFLILLSCATQQIAEPFRQRGLASWYGRGFQHRKTASGERFDMHALTAAHRTLPFGTMIRVKCLSTGKEVIVKINDRGPFRDGRILDLSHEAAKRLGIVQDGEAEVEIESAS